MRTLQRPARPGARAGPGCRLPARGVTSGDIPLSNTGVYMRYNLRTLRGSLCISHLYTPARLLKYTIL